MLWVYGWGVHTKRPGWARPHLHERPLHNLSFADLTSAPKEEGVMHEEHVCDQAT